MVENSTSRRRISFFFFPSTFHRATYVPICDSFSRNLVLDVPRIFPSLVHSLPRGLLPGEGVEDGREVEEGEEEEKKGGSIIDATSYGPWVEF